MTSISTLLGARIRRIDAPSPDLGAITLVGGATRGTLLVSLHAQAAGVGWVSQRPHGLAASSFVQKLRKEIEGAKVRAFQDAGPALELHVARAEQTLRLAFHFEQRNVQLLLENGELVASLRAAGGGPESTASWHWPTELDLLEARGGALLEERAASLLGAQRTSLTKGIETARKRLQRRLSALAGDAARAEQAPALRTRASLLLSNMHAVARGASSVKLLDYAVDPPAMLELTLDPSRGAREQAEAWFKQARRFERGAAHAAQRTAAAMPELEQLGALRAEVERAPDLESVARLRDTAAKLGVRTETASEAERPEKRRGPARHVPYRSLRGFQDRTILVGKGAADNDALTVGHARPQDLWLHARDVTGAHVVVPLERGEVCPAELLVDAALLAAHFSDSRGEAVVDVSYTPKRYVRKPKGSAIGAVQVEREKVMRVQLDSTRLTQLLGTQRD